MVAAAWRARRADEERVLFHRRCCMPQSGPAGRGDDRTRTEKEDFDKMLNAITDLYLTTRVLILLDNTYIGRFW